MGPPRSQNGRPRQETPAADHVTNAGASVPQQPDSVEPPRRHIVDPWAEDERRARQARDEAMAAQLNRTAAGQDRAVIDHAIRHLARSGRPFSANDVRELLPAVAPNLVGARFAAAARSGLIEACGVTHARHEAGRARLLRVWRGRNFYHDACRGSHALGACPWPDEP